MVICNMAKETTKLVAGNKKAFHEYFIEEISLNVYLEEFIERVKKVINEI